MSYRSGGYKSPFIGVGVVVGALALLFFGLRGLALFFNATGVGVQTTESVERRLFANALTGDLYRTYKRTYPQDYDRMNADVLRHLKARETTAQVDAVIAADMLESARLHRKDPIQAPANLFAAYRRAEIKVVEMLRDTDPRLCATYVVKGEVQSPEFRAFQKPLIAFRIAALEAGAAGRDHPVHRALASPTPANVQLLSRQMMANGTSQTMVTDFFNGSVRQYPPLDLCLVGLSFFHAIDQLPEGKGDEIYAYLLSRNT